MYKNYSISPLRIKSHKLGTKKIVHFKNVDTVNTHLYNHTFSNANKGCLSPLFAEVDFVEQVANLQMHEVGNILISL